MRDRSASARSVPARTDIAMLSMTIPKTHQATGELRFLTQSLSDNLPQPNHPKPVCGISPLVSTPSELSVDLSGRQPDAATSANGDHAHTTIAYWIGPQVVRPRQAVLVWWSHRYPDLCLSVGWRCRNHRRSVRSAVCGLKAHENKAQGFQPCGDGWRRVCDL